MRLSRQALLGASVIFFFGTLVWAASPASAQTASSLLDNQTGLKEIGQVAYGTPEDPTDIRITVGRLVNIVLGFLGVIFLILAVSAGFKYMTSGGNDEKTKEAVALLRNAVIGLLIVLAAWMITRYTITVASRTMKITSITSITTLIKSLWGSIV